MWEPYNYSSVFREPYRIQNIANIVRLPFPVVLVDFLTFSGLFLFEFTFFRGWIGSLQEKLGFTNILFYIFVPISIIMAMNKIKPDGKKVYFYLLDALDYFFVFVCLKSVYENFERKSIRNLDKELIIDWNEVKVYASSETTSAGDSKKLSD